MTPEGDYFITDYSDPDWHTNGDYQPSEADWAEYRAYLESLPLESPPLPDCDTDTCPVCGDFIVANNEHIPF